MIKDDTIYFIDFQGARMGPLQYDLASLLIDPYVDLPPEVQRRLLAYALEQLAAQMDIQADRFRRCYRFCSLTRNLQALGAFGYLTRVKGKSHFEKHIPAAVRTLRRNLQQHGDTPLPILCDLMENDIIVNIAKKKD